VDNNSGGTVTSITGGAGLTGGTITGSGTLAVDTAAIQSRVTGTCPAGESIRAIATAGSVTCEVDNDSGTITAVNTAAGSGLTGGVNSGAASLSLLTTCSNGQLLKFSAGGAGWGCGVDANGGGTVTSVATGTGLTGGPITGSGTLSLDTTFTDGRYPRLTANNTLTGQNTFTGTTNFDNTVTLTTPAATAVGPLQITHLVPSTGATNASANVSISCSTCTSGTVTGFSANVTVNSAVTYGILAQVGRTAAGAAVNNLGVRGLSTGPNGIGVLGEGPDIGVDGFGNSATLGIGVKGQGPIIGVQGYATGASGIAGTFTTQQTTGTVIRGFQGTLGVSPAEVFRVEADGDVFADGSYNCGLASGCFNTGTGADLAERIDVTEALAPGDVVEIDPHQPEHFRKVRGPMSTMVAGIVSTLPAVTLANNDLVDNETGKRTDTRPLLALAGRVPVKVTDEGGPIRPGDLLVSSSTPGHAMRCAERLACFGAILGKAMEPHGKGVGTVLALVTLQ
jgi:hypothetical protein